nr:succinate dehydrogenase hydrophobic subunit [Cavernulicola chilensis]
MRGFLRKVIWWTERVSAIILIPWFLILDINGMILMNILIILHSYIGMKVIIKDYVHQNNVKIIGTCITKLLTISMVYLMFQFLT